jgi:Spy/CpxP family protein refolding chaperone
MRLSRFKWLSVVAVVAALAVPAGAQTGGAAPAGGAGAADGQVGFQKRANLSPQQELAESDSQISRMETAGAAVRRQLEQARAARDVVKTLCLNDKLSQVDVAVRSAKDRRQSLQLAVGRNDTELSHHEYTILTVLRQRVEQLTAEANQCIGEEAVLLGDSKITWTVDPTLPDDDGTGYDPIDPGVIALPPSCVSCAR